MEILRNLHGEGQVVSISLSEAGEVTKYVTISWEASEDDNLNIRKDFAVRTNL